MIITDKRTDRQTDVGKVRQYYERILCVRPAREYRAGRPWYKATITMYLVNVLAEIVQETTSEQACFVVFITSKHIFWCTFSI